MRVRSNCYLNLQTKPPGFYRPNSHDSNPLRSRFARGSVAKSRGGVNVQVFRYSTLRLQLWFSPQPCNVAGTALANTIAGRRCSREDEHTVVRTTYLKRNLIDQLLLNPISEQVSSTSKVFSVTTRELMGAQSLSENRALSCNGKNSAALATLALTLVLLSVEPFKCPGFAQSTLL